MGNRYLCGGYRWIYGYFVILMGVIVIQLYLNIVRENIM